MNKNHLHPEHIMQMQSIAGAQYVTQDVCMKPFTSMRVGGNVAVFIEVKNSLVLQDLLKLLFTNKLTHAFFGNGSNLLVSDEGYEGVLLHISTGFADIEVYDRRTAIEQNQHGRCGILAGSGILLSALSKVAMEHSLSGLEFASGIPGSLGGALAMNAGAYDGEISYVVKTTRCMNDKGEWVLLQDDEHQFGYRSSIIGKEGLVAVESYLELSEGVQSSILDKMKDFAKRRQEKQPLNYPSSGSTFKRPVGYYSGQLIEDCGLKGMKVGGAMVSEKHAGFIVNTGEATATDVISLVHLIRERVFLETGVRLEPEVKLLKGDSLCNF